MCKIFKAYTHETVLYLTINPRKQKTNQTKTKLSPLFSPVESDKNQGLNRASKGNRVKIPEPGRGG